MLFTVHELCNFTVIAGQFYLDENTGELWATDKFNYDDQPFYTITVEADMPPGLRGKNCLSYASLQITCIYAKCG